MKRSASTIPGGLERRWPGQSGAYTNREVGFAQRNPTSRRSMSGDGAANLFFLNDQGAGAPNPTDVIGASVDTVGEYLHDLRAWEPLDRLFPAPAHVAQLSEGEDRHRP
jgi:hypothetical protein